MSNEAQLEDNLNTFTDFREMSDAELKAIKEVSALLKKRVNNGCTGCRYCMPCPAGVNIPANFALWNKYGMYKNEGDVVWNWNNEIKDSEKANNCIKCGKCEAACPQKIAIRNDLECVLKDFEPIVGK